ncbi:MAG: hypothetical protein ABIQ01_07025 [Pseudolysinimonas sp.]
MTRIFALLAPLAIGAFLGSIIGGIITGNDGYAIVWGIGGPILLMIAIFVGVAVSSAKKKSSAHPHQPTGINETVTGITKQDVEAVMNPSSSAAPSGGVVLNGQPVDATAAKASGGSPRHPVRLRRGIGIALVVAGAALALIPAYTMVGWVASDFMHGQPFDGRDMRTGLHQNDAVAQIAEVVGSPDMTYISFYDDYVIATARTSPRTTTVDSYMWRYGGAFRSGPGGFEPDLASELFDTSQLDFSIIPSLITIAKRDSGLNDADDYYPSVRRDTGSERPGEPVISISLSNDYFDAYYTFSFDGEILDKSGSAFE